MVRCTTKVVKREIATNGKEAYSGVVEEKNNKNGAPKKGISPI